MPVHFHRRNPKRSNLAARGWRGSRTGRRDSAGGNRRSDWRRRKSDRGRIGSRSLLVFKIRWAEAGDVLRQWVLILASVYVNRGPLSEATPEDATGFLDVGFARGLGAHGAVVEGCLAAGVIGDAKDEEAEIEQDGE